MVSDHPLHSGEFWCRGGVSDPPTIQIMTFAPISECTHAVRVNYALMTGEVGVAVGVGVRVGVDAGSGVRVGCGVGVMDGVLVGAAVTVGAGVNVRDGVGVGLIASTRSSRM